MDNQAIQQLTKEQIDFCKHALPNFTPDRWSITQAGAAGSQRVFLRLQANDFELLPYILILWDSKDPDWQRYLDICAEVRKQHTILPEIYAYDPLSGCILEEDFGTTTLNTYVRSTSIRSEINRIYSLVLQVLAKWHQMKLESISTIAERFFDKEHFLWETEYFANHCIKNYCNLGSLLDSQWDEERNDLANSAVKLNQVPIHRDFQSENIMLVDDRVKIIDFQGARLGPAEYDLASLLIDPYISDYVKFDYNSLCEFIAMYRSYLNSDISIKSFNIAAIQRLSQACGAYGKLYLQDNKLRYKKFIYPALDNLANILRHEQHYPRFLKIVENCLDCLPK